MPVTILELHADYSDPRKIRFLTKDPVSVMSGKIQFVFCGDIIPPEGYVVRHQNPIWLTHADSRVEGPFYLENPTS